MIKPLTYAAAIACCFLITGCKKTAVTDRKPEYAVITIGATDRELSESYSATIRGRQDIDIYPQISGTIDQVCIKEGENVRRQQTLFIIDQVPYRLSPSNRHCLTPEKK